VCEFDQGTLYSCVEISQWNPFAQLTYTNKNKWLINYRKIHQQLSHCVCVGYKLSDPLPCDPPPVICNGPSCGICFTGALFAKLLLKSTVWASEPKLLAIFCEENKGSEITAKLTLMIFQITIISENHYLTSCWVNIKWITVNLSLHFL
jgi:hypothetical protein